MKFSTNNPFIGWVSLCLSCLLISLSCNDNKESENNSTTVNYNLPSSHADTSGNNTIGATTVRDTDTTNRATGRTSTGGRRGRITVAAVPPSVKSNTKMEADKQGYYNYTESSPAFTGGQEALENYITNNIEYPQDAIDNAIEGTVFVQFAIDETGKISSARVTGNKIGYGLEEAATKAVSAMPGWTPGRVNGKNVKTWYTLPITFKLED